MTRQPVSFLLGAGFSKPADYPLAQKLNKKFANLSRDEFSIYSDMTARFHGGDLPPSDWDKDTCIFAERLTDYFKSQVGTQDNFDYEKFYDWCRARRKDTELDQSLRALAADRRLDAETLLLRFADFVFKQLLAQKLRDWYPAVHKIDGPPKYVRFLELIERLAERGHTLHFHSLNHDLFFESLSSTDTMGGELDDGFTELNSPYFGRLEMYSDKEGGHFVYKVRLPFFSDKFDSQFNLYKLHGSVDHYYFSREEGRTTVKTRRKTKPNQLIKQIGRGEEAEYVEDMSNYHPNILSGKTSKIEKYDSDPYVSTVVDHFESNLEKSNSLFVIGYGFGDEGINKRINEYFAQRRRTQLVVIDVDKPDIPAPLNESSVFYDGGVEKFSLQKVWERLLATES
jgi:hypothetical protein